MDKKTASKVVGWIQNTMLSADEISKHFALSTKDRDRVRALTKKIRSEMYPELYEGEENANGDNNGV